MTEPAATIRGYHPSDGEALRALWRDAGFRLIGDDDDGLQRFAERNPDGFLVAEATDGAVVGSTMAAWDGRRGWLYHVVVAPSHRRTGLGSALVAGAEDHLRSLGCERVLVLVEAANEPAIAFWSARGYVRREAHQLARSL
jgi:ribosomal protein S18 acetylase RimI-like enzyme